MAMEPFNVTVSGEQLVRAKYVDPDPVEVSTSELQTIRAQFVVPANDVQAGVGGTLQLQAKLTAIAPEFKAYIEGIRDEVEADRAEVAQNRADVEGLEQTTLSHKQDAAASLQSTQTAEQNTLDAEGRVNAAETRINAAEDRVDAAEIRVNDLEDQAGAHEAKAQEWADKGEDLEVEPGKFSANHHRAKAAGHDASATQAASNASAAQTAAEQARDQSQQSATDSANSAAASQSSATDSASSEANALLYRDKAQEWAEHPEDTEVEPGAYSSKHWAKKAEKAAVGGMSYRGGWDASTGSYPAAPEQGWLYKVTVQGTVDGVEYLVGDAIIHNGGDATLSAGWDHVDNTERVTSVAGKIGNVTLVKADVGLSMVRNVASYSQTETDSLLAGKLDDNAQAVDSAKLGGLNPGQFLRSDADGTLNGQLTVKHGGAAMRFAEYGGYARLFLDGADGDFVGADYAWIDSIAGGEVRINTNGNPLKVSGHVVHHAGNFDPATKLDANATAVNSQKIDGRTIFVSDQEPTPADGQDGDLWFQYEV